MKKIIILGATGSIGCQTREVIKENPQDFELVGVSIGHNIKLLRKILESFECIKFVTVQEYSDYIYLKEEYPKITFFYGNEGLISLIENCPSDLVVNSLVGFVGFLPSLYTIKKGIDLALANKESLVVGGSLIKKEMKKSKARLFAIDSEHCALSKCLEGKDVSQIRNLVITASGGSFRDYTKDQLENVTIKDALNHPSWSMGNKITIDSATMMNKGFEIIEAMHLFDFPLEKIKVLLHDESIIHSLVEFVDNSYLADIGPTDMKVAISYALYENKRHEVKTNKLEFDKLSGLHFRKLDLDFYPCLTLAIKAIKMGGSATTVLNRSNEVAVSSFLKNEIKFTQISKIIEYALNKHEVIIDPDEKEIIKTDEWAKNISEEFIRRELNAKHNY
ncbi:MAG: 1-deoxy-D-xylulose-5-phosphate reductoisomerase [Bacilli bacterium]|nr:1-deoxy-D-xylulose-5-phosphate reductoisomerase [Bacillales bacterium]MDY2575694.1 1-deoxy-D-xylulose-5-phosphate reductoisomerase [Bacilli bacterium]